MGPKSLFDELDVDVAGGFVTIVELLEEEAVVVVVVDDEDEEGMGGVLPL